MPIVRRGDLVYSSLEEEFVRLRELHELKLVGTGPEPAFERITELVGKQFAVPICLISLVTEDRQWFKSCIGVSDELRGGTEREAAFCQYVVASKETVVVKDTQLDERFASNRLVTRENGFRFYAGAPLRTETGSVLGTLCIIDHIPRSFETSQVAQLETMAEWVMSEIILRRELLRRSVQEEALREEKRKLLEQQETLEKVLLLLDRRHRLIQRILQASQEGTMLVDGKGNILFHNRNMLSMSLLSSADTANLQSMLEQLLPRQTGLRSDVLQPLFKRERQVICERFRLPDAYGGSRHFELYASAVSDPQEVGGEPNYLLTFRDRTEEEKVEELKNEFISTVSHELRTPMTTIRGFVEIMLNRAISEERQTKYLQTIDREATRLSALIDDFLDLQQMEAERLSLSLQPLDIGHLVSDFVVERAEQTCPLLRIALPTQPLFVQGDAERLRQVLHHLLGNAVKYAQGTEAIELFVRRDGTYAAIDICDCGLGIPEASIPYLFDKFYRVDNSDRRQIGGTGLGLAIVKQIVDSHRGSVSVRSAVGQGSTFTVLLPLAES